MSLNLSLKKSKRGKVPSNPTGEKGNSHSALYALAAGTIFFTVTVVIALFIYVTSRFDNLSEKMDTRFDNLSEKMEKMNTNLLKEIRRIDGRIEKWLTVKAVFSGHVKGESEKRILTDSGTEILENEQDLTKLLYSIYDKNPKTYPENTLYEIMQSLGKKKREKILSDHKISIDILQGIVVSFYRGVKYEKYLEKRPFLKKD